MSDRLGGIELEYCIETARDHLKSMGCGFEENCG